MPSVRLTDIAFDAGTQIRAAIDQQVVADYAEAMTGGAVFPPIVLFHDGNKHYLADGFHRFMAAQRIEARDIDADVRAGTHHDALWFALGANRTNGKRLTDADKTHAIEMAFKAWPERMQREVAEQVGCHQSLVSKVYQKMNGSQTVLTGRALKTHEQKTEIRRLVNEGLKAEQIARQVGVSRSRVAEIRVELGLSKEADKSRAAVAQRRKDIRDMAERGFASRQIAAQIGITEDAVRGIAKEEGIVIHADRVIGGTKRHDSNRIISQIVMDAENLTEGVDLIDFAEIDRSQLAAWLASLQSARDKLGGFIRRLMKEQQRNGEAA